MILILTFYLKLQTESEDKVAPYDSLTEKLILLYAISAIEMKFTGYQQSIFIKLCLYVNSSNAIRGSFS